MLEIACNSIYMETSQAKHVVACDMCAAEIGEMYPNNKNNISLPLKEVGKPGQAEKGQDNPHEDVTRTHHFCDEACLASFLGNRSKARAKAQKAKASVNIQGNTMELNITADARYISSKERNSKKEFFLDPERKSFPIENCTDVNAAVHAWGRYKGNMSFEEFKSKLTARAHALGCSLPDKWTGGDDKK